MWLRVALVVVVAVGVGRAARSDELLQRLAGARRHNELAVCVRGPGGRVRPCAGALVAPAWVLARAHCIPAAPEVIAVLRPHPALDCDMLLEGYNVYGGRYTLTYLLHPWLDFALLKLEMPYQEMDELVNATSAHIELQKHGVLNWIQYNTYIFDHNYEPKMNSDIIHPVLLCLFTFVMPMMAFIAFYIYIIFYTGHNEEEFKSLITNKKTVQC